MATMAVIRRAALACRVPCRLLSHSAASSAPHARASSSLLGHFYHPFSLQDPTAYKHPPTYAPAFQPLTASSPRLSLDFLPDVVDLFLSDSHLGLLLLRHKADDLDKQKRSFLVCDPVSRSYALVPPPPFDRFTGGDIVGVALLSRAADALAGLQAPVRGRVRHRRRRPPTRLGRFERTCVHAAGGMYWHILNSHFALALDAATRELSCLPPPAMMWGDSEHKKYRMGEMPEDGQLCVASMEEDGLKVCVRGKGKGTDNGWVLERHTPMREVLDKVPGLPKDLLARHAKVWLSDIDAGRTGRVFINTVGLGSFAYLIWTRESWSALLRRMACHTGAQSSPTSRLQMAAQPNFQLNLVAYS
ncbi:unnamed protein product [Alopecurus aequalis]